MIALNKIVKASLFNFNRNIRAKADQTVLLEQLIEFLELHSSAKQLSKIDNFYELQKASKSYYLQIGQQFFGCVSRFYCPGICGESDHNQWITHDDSNTTGTIQKFARKTPILAKRVLLIQYIQSIGDRW